MIDNREEDITFNWYNWGPLLCRFHITEKELEDVKNEINSDEKNRYDAKNILAGALKSQEGFSDYTRYNIFHILSKYFYIYTTHSMLDHAEMIENENFSMNEMHDKLHCSSMWINHMVAGEYNPLHSHSGEMSFVLYTELPEGIWSEIETTFEESLKRVPPGSIEFRYGTTNRHILKCITNKIFIPHVGDLFIFPNYLEHQVYPFQSDGTRVSISGNLSFRDDI